MKQLIITVPVGVVALIIGLLIGDLGETNQTLIIAGAIVGIVYGAAAFIRVPDVCPGCTELGRDATHFDLVCAGV